MAGRRRGKLIGTRTVYNDRLLMFMLRNRAPERFGSGLTRTGGASNNNAIDEMKLARLRKRWRQEWEAEADAKQREEADQTTAILDLRIERMRESWLDRMSPKTRAAFDALMAAQREDDEARWAAEKPLPPGSKAKLIHSSSAPNDNMLPAVCTPVSERTGKRTHPAPWDAEEGEGEE